MSENRSSMQFRESQTSKVTSNDDNNPGAQLVETEARFHLKKKLLKQWFLVGLFGVVFIARLFPEFGRSHGPLHPEFTVKKLAVGLIFFCSGLGTDVLQMKRALIRFDFYVYILGFNLFAVPFFVVVLTSILQQTVGMNGLVLKGLLVVGALPPPVSSAVILTRTVGGSTPLAICASVLGSLLGIFTTPLMLLLILSTSSSPGGSIVGKIMVTVAFPLVAGQVGRLYASSNNYDLSFLPISKISKCTLLLIIYSAFCDMFMKHIGMSTGTLVGTVCCIVFIQCILMFVVFKVTNSAYINFSKPDVVAAMFSGTHKSLTLGLPLLNIMFGSGSKELSMLSIPLLIYHPVQIMLGSLFVPKLKEWMGSDGIRIEMAASNVLGISKKSKVNIV